MQQQPIAVLASGKGSNLKRILQAAANAECPVQVRVVICDREHAGALALARAAAVAHVYYVNPKDYANRQAYDLACADLIEQAQCSYVVLAGYMRILSDAFVHRFANRIINIHPALLPSFVGAHAVQDALDYGVKITGCTIHLVDSVLDGGAILAQAMVPVLDNDDEQTLHARIQQQEHRLYPEVLRKMIEQGFSVQGRRVVWHDSVPSLHDKLS